MSRKLRVSRSPIHGTGAFAAAAIKAGTKLIEYRGRLLSHGEADALYGDGAESGHTFLFTLNHRYVIDANVDGNDARWINHSCAPNCEAVLHEDEGGDPKKDRVFIEAKRAIAPGEELTYDYGITLDCPHTPRLKKLWACRCGAKDCSGTMLKPKRKTRS